MSLTKIEAQFILDSIPKLRERVKVKTRAIARWADRPKPQCRYRVDGDGTNTAPENCCFVGVLIPPDKYSYDFEGKVAHNDELGIALIGCRPSPTFLQIMDTLQGIHDSAINDSEIKKWDGPFEWWVNWATGLAHNALSGQQENNHV